MAPNAPSDRIVHAICPSQMGKDKKGPGEMGPSDTVNDIAALAALSDLDQEERIEKVIWSIKLGIQDKRRIFELYILGIWRSWRTAGAHTTQ